MKIRVGILSSYLLLLPLLGFAYADTPVPVPRTQANTFRDILFAGDMAFRFRPRFEYDALGVYQNIPFEPSSDGRATTVQTRLRYNTAWYCDFFGVLDFDHVGSYFNDKQNSGNNTTPNNTRYPMIPDPKGTALVQAYVAYAGLRETHIIFGKQELSLDDERFVGYADFRQTPQTFTGISYINRSLENAEIFYAYVAAVNTLWQGNENATARIRENSTHLINVSSMIRPFGDFVSYAYLIDDHDIAYNSSDTYGLRYEGNHLMPRIKFYNLLEYARQYNAHHNPVKYHANYYHLAGGAQFFVFDLGGGLEILSGNSSRIGKAFRTPIATKHGANGLADQFRTVPNAGLNDYTAYLKMNFYKIDAMVQYHTFRAQSGAAVYGHEWDAAISRPFFKNYNVGIEFANFCGVPSNGFYDINKVWVTFVAEFT